MKSFGKGFMGCFGVGAAIIVVIIVVAVGSKSTSNTVVTQGGGASKSSAPVHVGGTLTLTTADSGSVAITVSQIIDPAQGADQFTTPDQGKRFVGVKLVVKDTGSASETDDVNTDVSVIGSDNQSYTPTFDSITGCTNFNSGTYALTNGETATGCVVFQVPTGVTVDKVQYQPSAGFSNQTGEWLNP
jgi:Domain of unknown function (DUF4352)